MGTRTELDRWTPVPISQLGKEPVQRGTVRNAVQAAVDGQLIVYVHGFSEPNPGLGFYGWVAADAQTGEIRAKDAGCLGGNATSALATYDSAIRSLVWAYANAVPSVVVRSDLQSLVRQVNGQVTCFSPRLRLVLDRITKAKRHMSISFEYVPVEENQQAIALARYSYELITGYVAPDRHVT